MKPLLILLALAAFATAAEPSPARPNLVLFLADDLSWADCSIYGGKDIRTPNMERIARDGMKFTHAFVASPSCAPSRAALLTALNPNRNGSMLNHQPPRADVKKWPAYFKELGYDYYTAAIGKTAHYGQVTLYGFDYASHSGYHEDTCISFAAEWLEKRAAKKDSKPLCIIIGTNWPHTPWPKESDYDPAKLTLPPTLVDLPETRHSRARYAAAVANADRDLGIIYDAVRKTLGENTLFMFTADHGAMFPFGKWNCYDYGLRTPLVATWPGHIAPGSTSQAMVSWIDILPTFIQAAGGTPPENPAIDGRSFMAALRGARTLHREQIFATHSGDGKMNRYPIRSVRTPRWRYIRNLDPDAEYTSHIEVKYRDEYWEQWLAAAKTDSTAAALMDRNRKRPAEELYDVLSDPWEQRNLAGENAYSKIQWELKTALDAWMKANGDEGMKTEHALPEIIPGGQKKRKAPGEE